MRWLALLVYDIIPLGFELFLIFLQTFSFFGWKWWVITWLYSSCNNFWMAPGKKVHEWWNSSFSALSRTFQIVVVAGGYKHERENTATGHDKAFTSVCWDVLKKKGERGLEVSTETGSPASSATFTLPIYLIHNIGMLTYQYCCHNRTVTRNEPIPPSNQYATNTQHGLGLGSSHTTTIL